jgi:hypothetical protein
MTVIAVISLTPRIDLFLEHDLLNEISTLIDSIQRTCFNVQRLLPIVYTLLSVIHAFEVGQVN